MINIIEPKYTSKDLRKLQENAVTQIEKKKLRMLYRINAFYNARSLILLVMVLCLMKLLQKHILVLSIVMLLVSFFLLVPACLGISDLLNRTIHPKTFLRFKKNGCEHPKLMEYSFPRIIEEAERIEAFCNIIKSHPNCLLQETGNCGVSAEYVENNFKRTETFYSELLSHSESLTKDFALDFSYLDKRIDKYLDNKGA